MQYKHVIVNSEEIFNWFQTNDKYGTVEAWCRCHDKDGNHEHWHMVFNLKTSKEALSLYVRRKFGKEAHGKRTNIGPIKCESHLASTLHYIGCSRGQDDKHIHVDRHAPVLHERGKQCYGICQDIARKYALKWHNWDDECRLCGSPNKLGKLILKRREDRENGVTDESGDRELEQLEGICRLAQTRRLMCGACGYNHSLNPEPINTAWKQFL